MSHNPVVFWEIASHNADESVAFLKKVFDWDIRFDDDLGFYQMPGDPSSGGIGGGVFTLRKAKLPFLTIFIAVDDVDAKAKLVEEHGGYIIEPPQKIGNSYICLFNEPSGVTLAMIQKKSPA